MPAIFATLRPQPLQPLHQIVESIEHSEAQAFIWAVLGTGLPSRIT